MGRLWNKWLVPALFAVILFLCIRVANDIPKHEYYWESNEWNFMLKDMLVVLFMSYPIFFLLKYWLRLCRKRKLVWWQEYGVVVLTVPVWCLLTMWVIRFLMGVSLDLYDVPVPAIVSMLLGGFFYIFLRNQMIQKENEAQRLQLEKIKNDQLQTELKFLKAQYHPHLNRMIFYIFLIIKSNTFYYL
ncbi:hypothetical protein [Bacteroides uniformis]|uniref:hypothetical protein n=1 Tax=Bacteroides uniformis TaxID=820 RepID=UPI003F2036AA